MTNLLAETIKFIERHGKSIADVQWVGSSDGEYAITWDEFTKVGNIDYNCGFGGQNIATDLVVVAADWWLERHEYDGSEWWEIKQMPVKLKLPQPFDDVLTGDTSSNIQRKIETKKDYEDD